VSVIDLDLHHLLLLRSWGGRLDFFGSFFFSVLSHSQVLQNVPHGGGGVVDREVRP
jgi:hypothetical protein